MKEPNKGGVILMAEDDSDDRLLVKDAIAECAWPVDLQFVENGEELLDYLFHRGRYAPPANAPRPAIILLDLNMPRKDGREALILIKADADLRRIPVVVFSTSKTDSDVARMYELGANSFISKPVKFDALVNVMRTLDQYWFKVVELPLPK